jgi:hypothetical protein
VPLKRSNLIFPLIVEPTDVLTISPVTSLPSTATAMVPNAPSVAFARPRSARITYCPGGTLGNSNTPSPVMRAPLGTLTSESEFALAIIVRLPGLAGTPEAYTTCPETSAVRVRDSETSMPVTSCERPTDTNCAFAAFVVAGKYARA